MMFTRIALYARVSSQKQAQDETVQSQVAALRERIASDGLRLDESLCFVDEGFSGSSLVRPALERLRDAAGLGALDRVYVLSPDRLARNYAGQVLLLEELRRQGVELTFLNHQVADSPEGALLLQMQGMIAEYERAKILDRTRRGRRFAAQQGRVSILSSAPYGYRYVSKQAGGGTARYEVLAEQAAVVREVFTWVGMERLTLAAAVKRLHERGILTATGQTRWDRTTLRGLLSNPAYCGLAVYGRTRLSERSPRARPRRGDPETPRAEKIARPTALSDQLSIPVPALVSRDLFDAVAEQLAENRRRQRSRAQPRYLLSGLLVCQRCGSAYCGQCQRRANEPDGYVYYRCLGRDRHRFGDAVCPNTGLNGQRLEAAVWRDVVQLLQDPDRLRQELTRRQAAPATSAKRPPSEQTVTGLQRRLTRLLDGYEHGWLNATEFETRQQRVRDQLTREEAALAQAQTEEITHNHLQACAQQFETLVQTISTRLANIDFTTQREILHLLIKRIEVDDTEIRIIYKVQIPPFDQSPASRGVLQHCVGRLDGALEFWAKPFGRPIVPNNR